MPRAPEPQVRQDVRIQQDGRKLSEEVGLGASAGATVGRQINQGAAPVSRGDARVVEAFDDAPFGEAAALERRLGQLGLFRLVRQPGQQPGLLEGQPPQSQRVQRVPGKICKGGEPFDLDLRVAERPGH